MSAGTDWLRELARWLPEGAVRPFGRPTALFFHGVEKQIDDPRIQLNHLDTESFWKIARTLKAHFQVLPLSALDDVLKHPERHERTVFLSSDDGYANALTVAAEVLDMLQLPWTLFASTHLVDTGERNPMILARLFLFYAPPGRYEIPNFGETIELATDTQRQAIAPAVLSHLRRLEASCADEAIAAMMNAFSEEERRVLLEHFSSERVLSWSDIAALAKRGVEIGGHAHFHWPMHAAQTPNYIVEQARVSREKIAAAVGSCRFFAYPFGNVGDISSSAWQAVRDAGYEAAFSTLSGSLDGSTNRWLLPRYGLSAHDVHLQSFVPLLRAGNSRLARWQKQLAA